MATVTLPSLEIAAATEQPAPTPAATESPGSLLDVRHRISVPEYHRMAHAGIFGPEPKIELLEGVLVDKIIKNAPHNQAFDLVQHVLESRVADGYFLSTATSMTIANRDGEPEPDEEAALVLDGREVARFAVRDILP